MNFEYKLVPFFHFVNTWWKTTFIFLLESDFLIEIEKDRKESNNKK